MIRKRSRSKGSRRFEVESLESRVVLSNYVVSPTGNDANPGTSQAPFATLQKAANLVQPGDNVTVQAGTYKGFYLPTSGTPAQRITFSALPGVTINQDNYWSPDGIDLEGANDITVQGFNVIGRSRAGIRAVLSDGVVIDNNNCDQNVVWGIYAAHVTNIDIEHNVASRSIQQHGIYIANSSVNPVIRDNTIWGNFEAGLHMNGDLSQGAPGVITGAVVEGNVIYNNSVGGGSAINCDGVQNSRIDNNIIYNNKAYGISLFRQDASAGSINDLVANNTILQPTGSFWAINVKGGSTGAQVENNILFNSDSYHGEISVTSDSLAGFKSDSNLATRFAVDDTIYATLALWTAATGQDAHSIASTPGAVFVDAVDNDYQLSSTSPAIGVGINLSTSFTTDVLGQARPAAGKWDLGAYRFVTSGGKVIVNPTGTAPPTSSPTPTPWLPPEVWPGPTPPIKIV